MAENSQHAHAWHPHTCAVETHTPKGAVTPTVYPAEITGQDANENEEDDYLKN